jgi:large subunit ribosomal protein L13
MKTYSLKQSEIKKNWITIDAEGLVLGRLASIISIKLRGKDKPSFTPHLDCGDNVIVTNAEKIHLKAKKYDNKKYFKHTGFPGGIKSITAKQILCGKHPERVLLSAVKRMLPKNKLANKQMQNIKVYSGDYHPHMAQKPQFIDIKKLSNKNYKRD